MYVELGGAPDRSTPGQTPIDNAIDAGEVAVADEPEYANTTVLQVMDDVRTSSSSRRTVGKIGSKKLTPHSEPSLQIVSVLVTPTSRVS